MADDNKIVLTATLIDEATTPLLRLKQVANQALDSIAAGTVKATKAVGAMASSAPTGVMGALSSMGTGLMNVGTRINTMFSAMGRGAMDFATNTAKAAGVAATALMATGVVKAQEIIQKGYQRVITMQDATAASAVLMGGDVGRATDLMNKIREVVTGTPFTLPDFAKAGQQMLMYGIGAEKIPGILTAIGEATAGQGARATELAARMGDTIAKMAATGQVQLGDMWSMAESGVPALNILANGFNTTTDDMKDMISKGLVPSKQAIDILTKGIMEGSNGAAGATASYAGSMKKLGETWSGALAIFEASKGRLGEAYILPLKDAMPGILTAMRNIMDSLQVFAPMWKAWLDSSGVLPKIRDELNEIAAAIKRFGTGGEESGLSELINRLHAFAPILAPLAGGLLAMSTGFAANIPIIGGLLPVINPLLGVLLGLLTVSPELRKAFMDVFGQIWESVKPLWPLIQSFLGMFMAMAMQLIGILADNLLPILQPLIVGFVEIATTIGGWVAEAIMRLLPPLVGFINQLMDRLVPILPVLMGLLNQVVTAFSPLIDVILDIGVIIINLATKILVDLLNALLPLIPPVLRLIVLFIEFMVQAIVPILPQLMELISQIIKLTLDAIIPLLPPMMDIIMLVLELAVTIGMELIKILIILFPTLIELLELLMPLIPPIMEIIKLLLELALQVLTPLIPIVKEVANFIGVVLKGALEIVMPFISDMIEEVKVLITWLADNLQPALSVVGGMFRDIGTFVGDVVRGVTDFVKAGFGWAVDFIKSITGGAGGGVAQASGGGVAHFAAGGVIGGYAPGVDTVPAMLSPGEAVLVPELVKAIGAQNILAANWQYSHRASMDGSSQTAPLGFGGGGGGDVNVTMYVTVEANGGDVDLSQLRAQIEEIFRDAKKRSY